MKYNYLEELKKDIKEYLKENEIPLKYAALNYAALYDMLFIEDSITGNASGSYTLSTYKAEEYLAHNLGLLKEACNEYGIIPELDNPEKCDVTIRCHLLGEALQEVLDEREGEHND